MANTDGSIHIDTKVDDSGLLLGLDNLSSKAKAALNGLTTVVTAAGAALTAMGGYAIKAGSDFESAFAGVVKTVDATDTQLQTLRDDILAMSNEIPLAAVEIAGIAEAAGQLGVKTEDISTFTRTMADLGVATNMTSEQAATQLARLANITGLVGEYGAEGYSRLGSAVVALGNNFATTESEIVDMSMRLASAGTNLGISESQILAFAAAMSSVGISAEIGGTSMSKFMSSVQIAVETGSKDLKKYASVAGLTAKEFETAFKEDAAGALTLFIQGLNDTERNGKSAIAVLEDLGVTDVSLQRTLLSLANSSGILTDAMEVSNDAFEENTALTKEAEQRYATFESKVQLAKNAIAELGIAAYDAMRGGLTELADETASIVQTLTAALKEGGFVGLADALGGALSQVLAKLTGFVPKVIEIGVSVVKSLADGIADNAEALATAAADVFEKLYTGIFGMLPNIVNAGGRIAISIAQGMAKKAPAIFESLKTSIKSLSTTITSLAPELAEAGKELLVGLGDGIEKNLPDIVQSLLDGILSIGKSIVKIKTQLLKTGGEIVKAIGQGIISFLPTLVDSLPEIIDLIVEFFATKYETIATVGADLLSQLVAALPSVIQQIGKKLPQIIQSLVSRLGQFAGTIAKAGAQLFSALIENLPAILSSIWDVLKSIDWIELGKQILESLLAGLGTLGEALTGLFDEALPALGNIDWSSIWTGIKNALGGIGGWIAGLFGVGKTGAEALSWSDVGTSVLTGIETVLDTGGTFLSGLFTAGKTLIEGIPWSEIGTVIDTGLKAVLDIGGAFLSGGFEAGKAAIEAIDWANLGTVIGNAVNGTIDTAGAFLSGCFVAAKASIEAINWGNLGTVIGNGVNGAIDTAGVFLSGCFEAAKSTIETIDWAGIGTVISTGINGVIDSSGAFLSGCFETAKTTIETIDWAGIGTTISTAINGVIDTGGAFLAGNFEAAKTAIEGLDWAGLGQGIADNLNAAISAISAIGVSFWNTVKGWFTSDEETDAQKVGHDLSLDVAAGMDSERASIEVSAKAAASAALDTLKTELGIEGTTSTKTKPYGEAIVIGITDGIAEKATSENFTTSGTKAFIAVRDALKTALGTDDTGTKADKVKFAGEGIVLGVDDGISNKASSDTFSSSATALATAAANALNSAFGISGNGFLSHGGNGASKFEYIGEAVATGIANGIRDNSSKITSAAKSAATAAYNAAKKQLGIHSPSKKGIELGRYFDEGIAGGIDVNTDKVRESVRQLSDVMYEKMKSAVDTQVGRNNGVFDTLTGSLVAESERTAVAIDYNKFGKAVWDNAPPIDLNIDGEKAGTLLEPHVSERQAERIDQITRKKG